MSLKVVAIPTIPSKLLLEGSVKEDSKIYHQFFTEMLDEETKPQKKIKPRWFKYEEGKLSLARHFLFLTAF